MQTKNYIAWLTKKVQKHGLVSIPTVLGNGKGFVVLRVIHRGNTDVIVGRNSKKQKVFAAHRVGRFFSHDYIENRDFADSLREHAVNKRD